METFVTLQRIKDARRALRAGGCLLIENAYGRAVCDNIVAWMDAHPADARTSEHYSGTERRIWDSQTKQADVGAFWNECNVFMSCLCGADTEAYTMLAIRNRPIDRGDTTDQLGRWHTDSFRAQYKIFLFLSDVSESSGPFEFIPRTQAPAFKMKHAIAGRYFAVSDLWTKTRAYSKFDDAWVERIGSQGYAPQPVLCSAGTVMVVDTSAVHRARPCYEKSRYALTAYFR